MSRGASLGLTGTPGDQTLRGLSLLERIGGAHAVKAMRVAQGMPAGRVALRPMFWMTRDQHGAMFALGGRF